MERKQIFGIIGSILLFIGVFTPIINIPILGSINYFNNGNGDGVLILILAIVSFIFVLTKLYKGLYFTGIGSLIILAYTFAIYFLKMYQITSEMNDQLADNPFKGLAETAINSVQIQWGWALLVIGAILLIISAFLKTENHITEENEQRVTEPKNNINEELSLAKINIELEKICPMCAETIKKAAKVCRYCGYSF